MIFLIKYRNYIYTRRYGNIKGEFILSMPNSEIEMNAVLVYLFSIMMYRAGGSIVTLMELVDNHRNHYCCIRNHSFFYKNSIVIGCWNKTLNMDGLFTHKITYKQYKGKKYPLHKMIIPSINRQIIHIPRNVSKNTIYKIIHYCRSNTKSEFNLPIVMENFILSNLYVNGKFKTSFNAAWYD